MGIRTASHAFDARGKAPEGHAELKDFDATILGGNYAGHHRNDLKVTVSIVPGAEKNALLQGVTLPFTSGGSLYKNTPLKDYTTPLLLGTIEGAPSEPVAWIRLSPTEKGTRRVFYTSLGHKSDFDQPGFRRLLVNGVQWALYNNAK
jgi:type 1 glutamine amidotransferase